MKYHKLEYNSLNIKETGTQFQSVEGYFGDIQNNIFPIEGKINFNFELPEPLMQGKAKPTTMLNAVFIPNGFLIFKDYFISFLNEFNIGEYQTWEMKVLHKNKILTYYNLFNLNYPKQRELIDFKKSHFYLGKYSDYKYVGKNIVVSDYENYLSTLEVLKSNQDNFLKCEKIVLDLSLQNIDLFKLSIDPLAGYYVSERLKNAIEEKGFTGMTFQEIEEMDKRIKVIY